MAAPLILYVREECPLCEQFLLDFSLDFPAAAESLQLHDVGCDAALALRFGLRVPVLEFEGAVICEGVYDRVRVAQSVGL